MKTFSMIRNEKFCDSKLNEILFSHSSIKQIHSNFNFIPWCLLIQNRFQNSLQDDGNINTKKKYKRH